MPHAYISGDCMECMACSDNVIRAGLTPKFKDIDALLTHVNYDLQVDGGIKLCSALPSKNGDPNNFEFVPPVSDFKIVRFEAKKGDKTNVGPFKSHAIFIILKGTAQVSGHGTVSRGSVSFMEGGSVATIESSEDLLGFAATSNN